MAEGKEEVIDMEQQQVNEMASEWWKSDAIRESVSGWYSLWGSGQSWSLTAVTPSETGSSLPAVSKEDHIQLAVETDRASSSESTCQG